MWTELTREDGTSFRAYSALPERLGADTPSVVMLMHIWGVDASMRAVAHQFADEGFAIVVPDLYARFGDSPDGDGATDHVPFRALAVQLTPETIDVDTRSAVTWLRERYANSKIAIAGFCMGGRMATHRLVGYANTYSAAAVWYGLSDDVDPAKAEIPIVASFGADDESIPIAKVEAFREKLPVANDFKIYPGAGHAFFDATRKSYVPDAAEDSWKRTLAFLKKHLA
jgi:carboxymethylenebutenolidase